VAATADAAASAQTASPVEVNPENSSDLMLAGGIAGLTIAVIGLVITMFVKRKKT
jgi:hypothetical protein